MLPFRARFGPAGRTRLIVAFTAAALLNLYWLSGGMTGLRIGYYLWAGSFVVVALLLWRARGFATGAGS